MDEIISYDDDILGWAEQQAAALRRLARSPSLPNDLDLEHIAEEIEDVGKAELHAVRSLILQILFHLVEAASSTRGPLGHWTAEVIAFHGGLVGRYSPSMHRRIDLDRLWQQALAVADARLTARIETLLPGLPASSPIALDDLLGERIDTQSLVARIQTSARL